MTGSSTQPPTDSWRPWIGRVVAVMAGAMLLYLALTIWSGFEALQVALRRFPLATHLPRVIGLALLGWWLRGLRWHYYLRYLRWPVPFVASLWAFLASFALTATPGKSGEVVKAGLLRSRYQVPMADTAGVLLVERLGDLLAVLLLAAGGLTLLADAWLYVLICLIGVGGITAFITSERLYRPLFDWLGRWPRLKPVADKFLELLATGRSLLRPKPFVAGLAIALVAWTCEGLAFHLVLSGFGLDLPVLTAFSIYGLATILGALSMLPGGVGGVEAGMIVLLAALGVAPSAAVAPVLVNRFSTLWLISLLGFLFLGSWWLFVERRGRPEA